MKTFKLILFYIFTFAALFLNLALVEMGGVLLFSFLPCPDIIKSILGLASFLILAIAGVFMSIGLE